VFGCHEFDQKPRETFVCMTTKSTFSTLAAPVSLAWKHRSPRVDVLGSPKSVESDNLKRGKAVIWRMPVKFPISTHRCGGQRAD
jgi:hypothetical protein